MSPRGEQGLKCAESTSQILGAFYSVYNRLGHGLAEVVYEREMAAELRGRGCAVASQRSARVRYGRQKRGRFRPDLVVDERVVVEIKARSRILNSHWAQLLHYLRVTGVEVGLILNVGPRPEFKRLVLTRQRCRE